MALPKSVMASLLVLLFLLTQLIVYGRDDGRSNYLTSLSGHGVECDDHSRADQSRQPGPRATQQEPMNSPERQTSSEKVDTIEELSLIHI